MSGPFNLSAQPAPSGAPLRNREPPASGTWTTLLDEFLHTKPGGTLDFSGFLSTAVPAGSRGKIRVMPSSPLKIEEENNPGVAVRLNVATWTASTLISLTSQASVTAGVQYLRRCGFNALRLHGPENWLMDGTYGQYSFVPERLDLFRFLMAECKRLGVYYVINPASYILYRDGGGGNRFNYAESDNAKPRMYTEQSQRDEWAEGFRRLYLTINPYTSTYPALDPACFQVELYNESGVTFCASVEFPSRWLTRTPGSTAAAKTWTEWLADPAQAHGYANLAALNASWGTAHASFSVIPAPPVWTDGSSYPTTQNSIDGILYGQYLEADLAQFYASKIAEWGITALTSMHHLYPQAMVSRGVGKFSANSVSNTHGYPMLVGSLTPGISFTGGKPNNPIWATSNFNVLFAHPFACSNKPRYYGEYGWSVWATYRNNYPIQAAMAAMQGAVGFSYYAQGDFFAERYYNDVSSRGDRSRRVYPYHGNSDPVHDFVRACNFFTYQAGYISEHSYEQPLILNDRFIGCNPRSTSRIGRALSYLFQPLYFLSGFSKPSLNYTSDNTDDSLAATWNVKSFKQILDDMVSAGSVTTGNATYIDVTANQGAIAACDITTDPQNPRFTTAAHTLVTGDVVFIPNLTGSGANWPGTNNKWTPYVVTVLSSTQWSIPLNTSSWTGTFSAGTWCSGLNIFEAATGEWGFSRRGAYAWMNAAKLKYFAHDASTLPRPLGFMSVTGIDNKAAIFIASLDGLALTSSKRMLIGLCGDAQNTGMTFTDGTRTTLSTAGDYPAQVTDCTADIALTVQNAQEFKLYRVGRDGVRVTQETPVSINAGTGQLLLKLRTGTIHPAVMWELTR